MCMKKSMIAHDVTHAYALIAPLIVNSLNAWVVVNDLMNIASITKRRDIALIAGFLLFTGAVYFIIHLLDARFKN